MLEFVQQLAAEHGIADAAILAQLDDWRWLTPELVQALGADRFPPVLTLVPS